MTSARYTDRSRLYNNLLLSHGRYPGRRGLGHTATRNNARQDEPWTPRRPIIVTVHYYDGDILTHFFIYISYLQRIESIT